MTNQEIVAKLWNLCNVLRDDGITYHQYVTELTYILFLKMAKETGTEDKIPEKYRWDRLAEKDGLALKKFYEDLLRELGEKGTGRIQEIYSGARSNIEEPANLKKIITNINDLDWYSAKEEGLGNLYEGLLEKNANEKKSGAGQYFTPRVLIDVMTELIAPQPGERCNDPACGTFGFMIAADAYVKAHTDDLFSLTSEQQAFQKNEAFTGAELVHETHRLALMNAMLHDIDGKIYLCDTLSNQGKQMNGFDVVLTNPPFGTKKGGERANRDDFTFQTSNKQLNFLQHIYRSLKADGKARAAVVLPDNVLFAGFVKSDELRDAYCGADVFSFMSYEETEGIVVLEALACEIPTIVRNIPVYEGWLEDEKQVYKAETIKEFQEKITAVFSRDVRLMKKEERKIACNKSLGKVGERLLRLYSEME
mgnify:CR=1 FL=1